MCMVLYKKHVFHIFPTEAEYDVCLVALEVIERTLNSRFACTWIVTAPSQELDFKRHMSWNKLCSVRLAKMRGHCSFC
jgi:hypothetical protein